MVQTAKALGAKTVIGVARNPEKLKRALDFGADFIMSTVDKEPRDIQKEFRGLCKENGLEAGYGWKIFEVSGSKAGQDLARYGSPLIQESIRRRSEEVIRRFAGHPLADRARKESAAILVQEKLTHRAGPDPRDLLAAGERAFGQGHWGLAELYLERLERDFPDAPAAKQAQELRNRIDGRLHGMEERAFEEYDK